jgi:SAM-dependent methyltransferase
MTDAYDLVPYECRAVPQAHPSRLATAAFLKGRDCAAPARCRYLELGCGDAANLLPLALAYPDASFVGVDRSRVMLDAGRALAAELGLTNLELVHADIAELAIGIGPFDYIVAHGVLSWVSDPVRARVLEIFARELAEGGVGYVSYNALPGWGLRGFLRDVLREHTRDVDDPRAKIAKARAHLARLRALRVGGERDPYAELLAQMIDTLLARSDAYLLHEYLAEHNRAFGAMEMIDELAEHGLAIVDDLIPATLDAVSQDMLEIALYKEDLSAREVAANVDLLTMRQLRASLIAHDRPARAPGPQQLYERCELAANVRLVDAGPWEDEQRFERPSGHAVTARTPLLRAALTLLGDAYPASVAASELLDRAVRLMSVHLPSVETTPEEVEDTFVDLVRLRGLGFVELRVFPPPLVARAGRTPTVTALTRRTAKTGLATSQLHEPVALDDVAASIAVALDGSRDQDALAATFGREALSAALRRLAKSALLIR